MIKPTQKTDSETAHGCRGSALVSTGIALAIPKGCYGRVAPRSGLALKNSIHVGAGVIDPDYRVCTQIAFAATRA